TADILSIPHIIIVALQNQGGAIGNMVCINNIVAVCATTGIVGAEGKILKTTVGPWFIYYLIVIGVMLLLMNFGIA
ncbi:MAG: L-lactate permease, partial [Selenomonadales bacterium]|nr:L-lactate permease [Selenomonadales bacterium]